MSAFIIYSSLVLIIFQDMGGQKKLDKIYNFSNKYKYPSKMGEHLSEFRKGQIMALNAENYSIREISAKLMIPRSTVAYVIKKWRDDGLVARRPGSGRPPSLNEEERNSVKEISERNPFKTAVDLRNDVQNMHNVIVSRRTIGRVLNDFELHGRIAREKPFLRQSNMVCRKSLAGLFLGYSDDFWKSVIFSDECIFDVFPTKNHATVYRRNSTADEKRHIVSTKKHGGGRIMVWGCISYNGVGNLVFIDGNLNSAKYVNLLANHLDASACKMGLNDYTFQQDGAPCHTSGIVNEYFDRTGTRLLQWAAQSPDLNPIEHIWAYMKKESEKICTESMETRCRELTRIWNGIPLELIQKLILSMPKRAASVFKANGGNTKY